MIECGIAKGDYSRTLWDVSSANQIKSRIIPDVKKKILNMSHVQYHPKKIPLERTCPSSQWTERLVTFISTFCIWHSKSLKVKITEYWRGHLNTVARQLATKSFLVPFLIDFVFVFFSTLCSGVSKEPKKKREMKYARTIKLLWIQSNQGINTTHFRCYDQCLFKNP